jgi:Uma2 family endonuclease
MGEPAARPASYEDLLQVPEHLVAEIIHGVLLTHPRPAPKHALSASTLGGKLIDPFGTGSRGPGGWWILDEPELHLGAQVLVPDLAGWRRERMPTLPDAAWFELAPDWVCEVLSPSTAKTDRTLKMPLYAQHGVVHLWLIDPLLRTLENYRLADGHWTLDVTLKDDDPVRLAPFAAIEFPLGDLWA